MMRANRDLWLSALVLLAGAFCLFANTFGHQWTYDDFQVIVRNPDVQSLGGFWADGYKGRPLRELSLLLDHTIFGLNPRGWHVQNIFWHGLSAWLLFLLARRLGLGSFGSWAAALLFLVHPLHVEVVANISHRKDSLVTVFSLLSLLSYMTSFEEGRRRSFWLSAAAVAFLLAFLAKEIAIVLPLVFAAWEHVYAAQEKRILARSPKIWAAPLMAAIIAGLFWYFEAGGREIFLAESHSRLFYLTPEATGGEAFHFAAVLKSLAFLWLKVLFPTGLAVEYVFPLPSSWADPWVLGALAGLAVHLILIRRLWRERDPALVPLIWAVMLWFPVMNLWPLSYFAADRYLYAPSAGFLLLAAVYLEKFGSNPAFRRTMLAAVVFLLAAATWRQNQVWANQLTLWTRAVEVSPKSHKALNTLGAVLVEEGRYVEALPLFQRSESIHRLHPVTQISLGRIYEELGDLESALSHYRIFLSLDTPATRKAAQRLKDYLRERYGAFTE